MPFAWTGGLLAFPAPEGFAPPCQGRPPKSYREIFQVLKDLLPEPE